MKYGITHAATVLLIAIDYDPSTKVLTAMPSHYALTMPMPLPSTTAEGHQHSGFCLRCCCAASEP
jgi:hypothetical protein